MQRRKFLRTAGVGGASFLAAELFKAMAGVDIVHVGARL